MPRLILFALCLLVVSKSSAQDFNYSLQLEPVTIENLPAIHSYAYGTKDGKWIIIGGRLDGIHPRQPFNAFPANRNNATITLVDLTTQRAKSISTEELPVEIREHLQAANFNYYQDGNYLLISGGYAYSESAKDHITFPCLTIIDLPELIRSIENEKSIVSHFRQLKDSVFAVTGGHLVKLGDSYLLAGGHRFDGRYNPMLGPTFVQRYTNEIRSFRLDLKSEKPILSGYRTIQDPVHLHRRDYNLIPDLLPDGRLQYLISSGVFQINFDLPFLYPVAVNTDNFTPYPDFYQYLSNYHSATVSLYDRQQKLMSTLFFGGMSQYYYRDGHLIQDNEVPFVKTISRLSRTPDGKFHEYKLREELPGLQGGSSEFILAPGLPLLHNEIIDLNVLPHDTVMLGYIFGGIHSLDLNPFSNNETDRTRADASVFKVSLIPVKNAGAEKLNGHNPHKVNLHPLTYTKVLRFEFELGKETAVSYVITDANGDLIKDYDFGNLTAGKHSGEIDLGKIASPQTCFLTIIFDNIFYITEKAEVDFD